VNALKVQNKPKLALNIWGLVGLISIPFVIIGLVYNFRVEIATIAILITFVVMGIIAIKNKYFPTVQDFELTAYYDTLAFEYMIEALAS
jgi:hypothetical protein